MVADSMFQEKANNWSSKAAWIDQNIGFSDYFKLLLGLGLENGNEIIESNATTQNNSAKTSGGVLYFNNNMTDSFINNNIFDNN